MKGICHIWSRGRLISPSLPVGDDWYLKRPTGRNLGGNRLVRRSGTTSRGTALLVFYLRMRSFPRTEVLTQPRSQGFSPSRGEEGRRKALGTRLVLTIFLGKTSALGQLYASSLSLLFLGHRSLMKNKTQTAMINILNLFILIMT